MCYYVCECASGRKLAYVQYHMRPYETFREPSRKFFDCEIVRSPICQEIDIDSILGTCCVLDLPTYSLVCCFYYIQILHRNHSWQALENFAQSDT